MLHLCCTCIIKHYRDGFLLFGKLIDIMPVARGAGELQVMSSMIPFFGSQVNIFLPHCGRIYDKAP